MTRVKMIKIRVSEQEYARVTQHCARLGVSVSDWIRTLAFNTISEGHEEPRR